MRRTVFRLPILSLIGLGYLMAGHAPALATSVTDMHGQNVILPDAPRKLADLWFPIDEFVAMLGGTRQIAVTVARPKTFPWLFRMVPDLRLAKEIDGPVPNGEALLQEGVNLALVTNPSPAVTPLRRVGIETVDVGYTTTATFERSLRLIASILDTPDATRKADRYAAFLNETIGEPKRATSRLSSAQKPRVLHIQSISPLQVDGRKTIVDEWIDVAGGINAAAEIVGTKKAVSMEQIAAWNPDVIVLGSGSGEPDATNSLWQSLTAVREKRVYRNPSGAFAWDRYAIEYPLEVKWAAHLLHPDLFGSADLSVETAKFYQVFLGYAPSAKEVAEILSGLPPGVGDR